MSMVRELNRTQKVEAAYANEQITRERVDVLEAKMRGTMSRVETMGGRVAQAEGVLARGIGGRLRWLLLGR